MLGLFVLVLSSAGAAAAAAPLDPAHAARIMADHMIADAADRDEFQKWGYGQSIVMDALILASEQVDGMDDVMPRWVNPVLDGFLVQPGSAAYNLTRGIPISLDFIGNAVACIVVARWENEVDEDKLAAALAGQTTRPAGHTPALQAAE